VVFDNVQEGLIKIDRTGKMVPWLAERWYTTDSKNYTFFLRKGVRFHNGREVKAADVKFALDRAVNPETKHPYRTQYDAIQDVIVGINESKLLRWLIRNRQKAGIEKRYEEERRRQADEPPEDGG
jgi:ABC-type transport system substrate-binding protein